MQKAIETNNGLKGGLLKGKAHYDSNGNPLGGIKAVVTDQGGKPIEVEGNEVIINKKTVQSEKVLTIKGTPKEILSTLNQMDGNGVAIGDEEAEILAKYRTGGRIPREKQIYLGKEGGSNVSPKGMFESAVQMENEGIDSETIRSITGWFRNPFDKLWRFEISDENMEIIFDFDSEKLVELESFNNPKLAYKTPLKKVIIHNELFKAYPSIKDLEICFIFDKNSDVASLNVDSNNNVTININLYGNRFRVLPSLPRLNRGADFKAVITHELQHVIQVREGLSGGSSVKQEYKKLLSSLPTDEPTRMEVGSSREDFLWGLARRNYLNSLGEIESRDSQERVYFDKKTRIEIPPYSLINFNNEEVIVVPETKIKFREGGSVPNDINKLSLNEFEKYLEEKYNSKVELGDYKKYIYLSRIEVDKETRGLGIGSEIMSEIIDYADYNDKKITLTPSTDYGASSVARLKDFYKNFGFVENKGRNKDFEISQLMYRVPKVNKYHLGGDMSKHLAPNGKPSNLTHEQWHLVRTPEFKAWFGDWENDPKNSSKVIDENGEPLVVYHGTTQKFNSFDKEKQNLATGFGDFGAGFYFTSSFNTARYYTLKSEKDRIIMNVFLNIKKPFIVELNWEKLSDESIYNYKKIKGLQGYQRDIINDSFKEDRPSKYITKNIGDFIFQDILIVNGYDGVFVNRINIHKEKNVNQEDEILYLHEIVAFEPNQIKLADGTNTTFDSSNDDIRFAKGGSISRMTPSELKAFYASPEGKKLDAQTYSEWNKLVNMSKSELEKFYNSVEGKKAGLTTSQAKEQGIDSGRESARWIIKMKDIPYTQWSSDMWRWAKKQINFIKRMTGMKGSLYNDKGEKTRKHTALLIWGHNPEQKFKGGGDVKGYDNFKNPILINGFISNKKIDGKEIFLITYNSGGQEGLNVHQTMNPLAMLDAVEKKTGLHTNTLQVFIYEHTENSNRIETEDELEFLKDNYTVIIVDRDSVEFYNGLKRFRGGGELSKKALAVETNDLTDFVRKYFIKDGRIDVADAMQELFGNRRGKSIADEYRKRIGLHKKGGLTISQLAHNLWEQHRDEVREGIDDSDFRNAVEEVLISEYGVSSMIKSLMEKSGESEQDKENEYWMNQFDEGDDEYYEDLSDEEVADYFKDMEGFERELAKGTEHEMEHLETLKKVAEGKLTPEEAVVETASKHLEENKNYYEDLAKMERENKEISIEEKNKIEERFLESKGYEKLVIGIYGDDSVDNAFQGTQAQKGRLKSDMSFGLAYFHTDEYSGVSTIDKDLMEWISEGFSGFAITVFTNAGFDFHSSSNGVFKNVTFKKVSYSDFLKYKDSSESEQPENEESIPDLIEGLKVLAESLEGAEKKEIEDVIEGLEILLESDNKFAKGGSIGSVLWATKIGEPDYNEQLITENPSQIEDAKKWALANGFDRLRVLTIDNSKPDFTKGFKKYAEGGELDKNSMIFEPSKSEQDEEKRIMENQFGKNI